MCNRILPAALIEKIEDISVVIPAHAGIQTLPRLDSGSCFLAKAGIKPACPE